MLPKEILNEYDTEKTAQNFGKKLFLRYFQDLETRPGAQVTGISMDIWRKQNELQEKIDNPETPPEERATLEENLQKLKAKVIYSLLKKFEEIDPTNNKEYVQWLVRTYINSQMSIEDVSSTVAEYLAKFNALKIKRHIKPPKNDIGQYKDFNSFMDEIDQYQDPLFIDKEKQAERGKYEVMYDADNLLILKPKDKTAACFFGRGTRWCTAAKNNNYFSHYNKQGPMYIIIPRKPEHPGEKYQFHFQSKQFAEETDKMLTAGQLISLAEKYPQLKDIFKEQAERDGLVWLQKPIVKNDENYTLYIYKKRGRPWLRVVPKNPIYANEEYFIEQDGSGEASITNQAGRELEAVEKYNFAENLPGLAEKLNINLDGYDPKTTQKQELGDKTFLRFNDKYVIVNASDGQYLISSGDSSNTSGSRLFANARGIYKYTLHDTDRTRYSYTPYSQVNPYNFMIQHPEVNTMFQTMLNQIQNNSTKSSSFREDHSWTYGWMAPHTSIKMQKGTVYEFGQNGEPISYYIPDSGLPSQGIVISMDSTGGVNDIRTIDSSGGDNKMSFLQQIAVLDQYPELKKLLPNDNAFNPKEIDLGNAILEEYHTEHLRSNPTNPGTTQITKNYFLIPKEPKTPGEKFAISVTADYFVDHATDELSKRTFRTTKIYAFSANRATPIELHSNKGGDSNTRELIPGVIIYLNNRFPKLSEYLDIADGLNYTSSSYRTSKFVLGATVDNDRIKIQRFDSVDDRGFQRSHGMPKLVVTEKKTGDAYILTTHAKDNRGNTGKISKIDVSKIPKDLINWQPPEDNNQTDKKNVANISLLKEPDIISLFRKYPEMIDIIKKENIHPKNPHPALVRVTDTDQELQVETDTFKVERTSDNPNGEFIFFKNKEIPNIELTFPPKFGYSNDQLPSLLKIKPIEYNYSYTYGAKAWYKLINDVPEFKEYINNRVKNGPVTIVGAGQPTEIKNIRNTREYIFDGNDGRLLYFVPITNPVKDSPEDTADNTWHNNGLAVPLVANHQFSGAAIDNYFDSDFIKKEIQDQADEIHSKHDVPGSTLHKYLANSTATVPENLTQNKNIYTIEKIGTKAPVYKFLWNLPPEVKSSNIKYDLYAPSSQHSYKLKLKKGEAYPNPELAELFAKIMEDIPSSYGYGAYDSLQGSNGVYVRPDTGDIGVVLKSGELLSWVNSVRLSSAVDALYKNIPEIKKLINPKKAKTVGMISDQIRKLQSTYSDDEYYLVVTKKPKGMTYSVGRSIYDQHLDPGTVYNILFKPSAQGDSFYGGSLKVQNTLYFPDKGPVVIFSGRGDKESYTTDQKISRFLDRFPELKEILQPFAKSNKWVRESSEDIINFLLTESELVYDYFDETTVNEIDPYLNLLENELAESLGDLAWAKKRSQEIKQAKKEWKPNYHFVKPGELAGSYTDQQMKDMGFKMASSGNWYMPITKFQDLIKSGKLREDEQAILEGKKLPRTSEFLYVRQDLQRLAGISEQKDDSMGPTISYTDSNISKTMKDKNIQPGTDEWFRLWFAKSYLTGETLYGSKD